MQTPELIKITKTLDKGNAIITTKDVKRGDVIFRFLGNLLPKEIANKKSLQIDEDTFLESTVFFDDNLNHSCDPNCYINFQTLALIAKKTIKKGEELTFNYHTSEHDMVEQDCSFVCKCNSKNCVGIVKGFRYLTEERKKEMLAYASPFIQKKYKEESLVFGKARFVAKTTTTARCFA